MAPNELANPIIIGLRFNANPTGIAAHSSSIPNKKTLIIDNNDSNIFWPPIKLLPVDFQSL